VNPLSKLFEELEQYSERLKENRLTLESLQKQYRQSFDSGIRIEISRLSKESNKLRKKLFEKLYENLEELSLIKKEFEELYTVFLEDEDLSFCFKKLDWVLDFKPLPENELNKQMEKINSIKKQLNDIEDFLKKGIDYIDGKALSLTWEVFKGQPAGRLDRLEVEKLIKEKYKEWRRKEYLLILNEPLITNHMKNLLEKLRRIYLEERVKLQEYESSKERGMRAESDAHKLYKEVKRKRKKTETILKHLLLSNPVYLKKVKSEKRFGGTLSSEQISFIDSIRSNSIPDVNEWKKQMRKDLEL